MIFSLELGKHSSPGTGKQQNEDRIGYYFPQNPEALLLRGQMFMIADGKGDDGTGAFASKLAIQTIIQEYFDEPWIGTVESMVLKAMQSANTMIYEANIENQSDRYFSTSLTCAIIHQDDLYIAHVGNCCAYFVSGAGFEPLTQSHVIEMDRESDLPAAQKAPNAHYIVRSLGIDEHVEIDIIRRKLQMNDLVLLCTDGVYQVVPESRLQSITIAGTPQHACDSLLSIAAENGLTEAATALIVKLKSIRRVQEGVDTIPTPTDSSQPPERQIVIKGVRYRTPIRVRDISPSEKEFVEEFSQDRELRRPIARRAGGLGSRFHMPLRQILNLLTIVILIGLILTVAIKYGPGFWNTISNLERKKTPVPADTMDVISPDPKKQTQQPQPLEAEKPSGKHTDEIIYPTVDEAPAPAAPFTLNTILIDGSFSKNITWDRFLEEMRSFSGSDKVELMQSTLRLKKSKILWRRAPDARTATLIKARVDQYARFINEQFQIRPEVLPSDLTLVIGADFKLPLVKTGIFYDEKEREDCYLEILNGYTLTGLAGRVNQLLDSQPINGSKITVVDYRNADKKNYRVSFIKCDASQNQLAAELKVILGQPISIVNTSLFDIKILIGTDIRQ